MPSTGQSDFCAGRDGGTGSCWQNDAGDMYGEIFAVQEHASMSSVFMNNFIILAIDQQTLDDDTVNTELICTLKPMLNS